MWLSLSNPRITDTVIVHFAEKGENSNFSHCPDPRYTYELTKADFEGKEVWVIPEWEGNFNLTARCGWLEENFTGIPVVIDPFEGGDNPTPNVMLSTADLKQIMSVANVTAIRFPEVLSWYMRANETHPVNIPIAWIHDMFDFAISKNLKIYWSEWKLGNDIETLTNVTLAGYEDKITYLYQTNNQYQHPLIGYSYAHEFPHWGASVQSWYVNDQNETKSDLPIETVKEYAMLARNMGAEIIQFEPYWYFFDNSGAPRKVTHVLWATI